MRLYNSALEYKSVLEQKKTQFENELRTLAKDKKNKNKMDKIIYYKREIENRLNKRERFEQKYLIERAWRNCTIPYYINGYMTASWWWIARM